MGYQSRLGIPAGTKWYRILQWDILDFGETRTMTELGILKKLYVFDSVLSNSRDKYGEWSENPLAINSFMDISEYVSLQRGGDAK